MTDDPIRPPRAAAGLRPGASAHIRRRIPVAVWVVLLGACGPGAGPGATPGPPAVGPRSAPGASPWAAVYARAVADARNPEPHEVVHDLVALVPGGPGLEWREIGGEAHVRMVSVVGTTSYYEGSVGGSYDTGSHSLWVTAWPELHERCARADVAAGDGPMRLRQLLGLTPDARVVAAVEFWVRPDDLFRPAPDPEVTDSTAGLALPDDVATWYRAWFNDLRATQYAASVDPPRDAYPWTQLGYTYDWGGSGAERGLSEFVVRTDARVQVRAIVPLAEYCRW